MNEYAQLDRALRSNHVRLLVAADSTAEVTIEEWMAEEARICARMRAIDETDHAQVEAYRREMGWRACFRCQDEARVLA